jgi:hypothetical protein
MPERLLRLYPEPRQEVELRGLYLAHELHRRGGPHAPFVYADFVSSLDGRIAVADLVPPELIGGNDLRLLLELQAQADCVITHAGYLRALAEGRLGDILNIGAPGERTCIAAYGGRCQRQPGLSDPSVAGGRRSPRHHRHHSIGARPEGGELA